MHFNENHLRPQATLKDGTEQWRIEYPKSKSGEHTVRVRRTCMTFSTSPNVLPFTKCYNLMCSIVVEYVHNLIALTIAFVKDGEKRGTSRVVPPPLCSSYERISKGEAVEKRRTRYNVQMVCLFILKTRRYNHFDSYIKPMVQLVHVHCTLIRLFILETCVMAIW
jgi:hypothetical protein